MTAQDRANERWGCDNPHKAERGSKRGTCNTRFEDSYCPPERRIGLDTVSVCWSDPDAVDAFLRLDGLVPGLCDNDGHKVDDPRPLRLVPAAAGSVRLNRRLDGLGQVGAYPAASMLYIEGRAGALHKRNETDHGLGKPSELPPTLERTREDLARLLGRKLCTPGIRRADLAGELLFDRGEDGQDLLRILDAMHSPDHKTAPVRERGGPCLETVYWRTPKRSVAVLRAYDKGVESGTAAPGERVRLERQVRYQSNKRPAVDQFLARDLGSLFVRPIRSWLDDGLTPGTADQLLELLTDAAVIWPSYWASGRSWASSEGRAHVSLWPPRKVERIAGTLALAAAYGSSWPAWSPKQRQRRMHEIRQHGLLLLRAPPRVDVDREVARLCEAWATAA